MKYIITLILLAISNLTHALSYTQEVTEAELQQKIEAMMPLEKKTFFVTITVTAPKLNLLEGSDALSIKADIAMQAIAGIKGSGTTTISGSITYNPTQGSFHLLNPTIVDLHIVGIEEQYQAKIKQLAQTAITNSMANFPYL